MISKRFLSVLEVIGYAVGLLLIFLFFATVKPAGAQEPTYTPVPTWTPRPTYTPAPTMTPYASVTPAPTVTAAPTPSGTQTLTEALMSLGGSVVVCQGGNSASDCSIDGSILEYSPISSTGVVTPDWGDYGVEFWACPYYNAVYCNNESRFTDGRCDLLAYDSESASFNHNVSVSGAGGSTAVVYACVSPTYALTPSVTLAGGSVGWAHSVDLEYKCDWGGCESDGWENYLSEYDDTVCGEYNQSHQDDVYIFARGEDGCGVGVEKCRYKFRVYAAGTYYYECDVEESRYADISISYSGVVAEEPELEIYQISDSSPIDCSNPPTETLDCEGTMYLNGQDGIRGIYFCENVGGTVTHNVIAPNDNSYYNNGFAETVDVYDDGAFIWITHTEESAYISDSFLQYGIYGGTPGLTNLGWNFCGDMEVLTDTFIVSETCGIDAAYLGVGALAFDGDALIPQTVPAAQWNNARQVWYWDIGEILDLGFMTFDGETPFYTLYPDWECFDENFNPVQPDGGFDFDWDRFVDIVDGSATCIPIPIGGVVSFLSGALDTLGWLDDLESIGVTIPDDAENYEICVFSRTVQIKPPFQALNALGLAVTWLIAAFFLLRVVGVGGS